jgi:glycogen(starch) synthase
MRVLVWSELFWPYIGGIEVFNAKLVNALRERGHDCIVFTLQTSSDLAIEDGYNGTPVYRFPLFSAWTNRDIEQLAIVRQQVSEIKRNFRPDLIHIHGLGPSSSFLYLQTLNAHPCPMLLTLADELRNDLLPQGGVFERLMRSADWVNGVSEETLAGAHRRVPEIITRSSVIYYGLDAPSLLPTSLPLKAARLLCLGRLTEQKGFDLALTALSAVLRCFPTVKLVIAGDGPERSNLERQAADLDLRNQVEFIGWVHPDQVPGLMNSATIVLMPSRWEGLPLVSLQAGLMARPVIAFRVSGIPEAIVHNETGLLVNPEDSNDLADAICYLFKHAEIAMKMGQAGRDRVRRLFGWQRCVEAYEALYQKLAGRAATERDSDGERSG